MKTATTIAASSLLASVAHAQVLQWDIQRRDNTPRANGQPRRRATSTFTEVIANEEATGGYFANITIGTPAQSMILQLDTGSSDIWVPYSGASVCQSTRKSSGQCVYGSFNPDSSTTFTDVNAGGFSISYVDGSHSDGDYFTDVFSIGGASLTNLTMGLGLDTDIPYGLIGVGYALDEAIVSEESTSAKYNNLPILMVNEGLISSVAYSLWLNDLDASSGQILFGGVDTGKYKGDLTSVDVIKDPESNAITSFNVYLTSVSANSTSGSDSLSSASFPINVVLDSGTTLSYVPTDLATEIWKEVGAEYWASSGAALLPCSMESSTGTFTFGFGGTNGPKISVDMSELVLSLVTEGSGPTFPSGQYKGQEACEFGIQNFSSDPFLLGDTFLRSAYVVYDLVNNQIALAQTDFNSTSTNVVPFASSGAPIPSATVAANQVTSAATSGSMTNPTYGASAGFNSNSKSAASTVPTFEWAPVGVMGASVLFMLVGSGFFLL